MQVQKRMLLPLMLMLVVLAKHCLYQLLSALLPIYCKLQKCFCYFVAHCFRLPRRILWRGVSQSFCIPSTLECCLKLLHPSTFKERLVHYCALALCCRPKCCALQWQRWPTLITTAFDPVTHLCYYRQHMYVYVKEMTFLVVMTPM